MTADAIIREAEAHLRASKLGRAVGLKNLPMVFVLGDSGTAKTSSIEHSGLGAELLGGQVYENDKIVPTRGANLWYAKGTAFAEVNTDAAESGTLSQLLRRLQPGKIRLLKGDTPARAAVVCFSCEAFDTAGAAGDANSLGSSVRRIRACLEQAARSLGVRIPVYVLFTKSDQIRFFEEFTRNLSADEAEYVLGVTLPLRSAHNDGVYAEQEAQLLNVEFNNLILSLADKRLDFLPREHDPQKVAAMYEFPRELSKLRSPIVRMLVDLCRPSQLRATPFLRGFYFSGVRPVIVNEVVQARMNAKPQPQINLQLGATGMFDRGQVSVNQAGIAQPKILSSRKVPRWTFLTHFFNDVLLQDHVALATTTVSVRTNPLRRLVLLTGIFVCFLLSLAALISYSGNRKLQRDVATANKELSAVAAIDSTSIAPVSALAQLDALRQSVEQLSRYHREGAPLHLRWGLYSGEDLHPAARAFYFSAFHRLLFGATQAALLDSLKRIPLIPAPGEDSQLVYETLKAYLITTSNHDKSTLMFLSPVLIKHWTQGRSIDGETVELAKRQFDFYAEQLVTENPFSSENDALAVERARHYLVQSGDAERFYSGIIEEASNRHESVVFSRKVPGSAGVVIDGKEVPGAYTKSAWSFIQEAIKTPDRFAAGDKWVVGDSASQALDRTKLQQELTKRYTADFIAQWQEFLRAAAVVPYSNVKDAAAKLGKLASNQSPLLALLCIVSQNTAVESDAIKAAFQPVQFVLPSTCPEQPIGEPNSGYMNALVALSSLIEQMANTPGGLPNLSNQALESSRQAKVVTRQIAQKFRIDPISHSEQPVQKLMEDPITYAELVLSDPGPAKPVLPDPKGAELNKNGKVLCSQFDELTRMYPFDPQAATVAELPDVNGVFQPQQGALSRFYEANLRPYLIRTQGSQVAERGDSPLRISPIFVSFWNKAAQFTDALYPDNSAQPRMIYTVRPHRVEGMENVALAIDGQTAAADSEPRQFVWSGDANSNARLASTVWEYTGPWAVFRLFGSAVRSVSTANGYTMEWEFGPSGATQLKIRVDLGGKGAVAFQKNFLASLKCVPTIVP